MPSRTAVLLGALALAAATPALAQQPARNREPRGFEFSRDGAWRRRARAVQAARAAALVRGDVTALNAPVARAMALRGAPSVAAQLSPMAVGGILYAPVLPVDYKNTNTGTLFTAAQYQDVLFDPTAPPGRPLSLRTFYEQMSNGMLSVQGQVQNWAALDSNDTWYEGTCNGDVTCSGGGHVPQLILEAVQKNDAAVDFGQFDNDGPDGIPNSGDDDGFVDIAIILQPEVGAECQAIDPTSSHNIWSHRFSYAGWGFTPITTNDPRTGGGFIHVNDYIIQPAVGGANACDGTSIMPIGTVAHELGHGFDLPDLYDTNPSDLDDSEGIGEWGLMGSGNYARPLSPAHMEGWSRFQLGWVTLVNITADGTYGLGPYTVSDSIYRISPTVANPRGEYFLIENRQATDGDTALIGKNKGPGLLIYHFDQQQYNAGLFFNMVNSGAIHGLWLLQADGRNQLRSSTQGIRNRGDAGDPFPGDSGKTALDFGTNPNDRLNTASGSYPGFSIDSIRQVSPNGPMTFHVVFPPAVVVQDTALSPGVMGAPFADTLRVTGGNGTYVFTPVSTLPPGISLSTGGVLSGIPVVIGTSNFTVAVASGPSSLSLPLRLTVTAPQLDAQSIADQLLLGGAHLTVDEQRYLDLSGNLNSAFDVGDVSAWLDRNPTLAPTLRRLLARSR